MGVLRRQHRDQPCSRTNRFSVDFLKEKGPFIQWRQRMINNLSYEVLILLAAGILVWIWGHTGARRDSDQEVHLKE